MQEKEGEDGYLMLGSQTPEFEETGSGDGDSDTLAVRV